MASKGQFSQANEFYKGLQRREYTTLSLRRKDLLENPFDQFRLWFKDAEEKVPEPNAMQLATTDGVKPSLRTVLLKGIEEDAFVFFTNYQSRKALELKRNHHATLLFFWPELERQITIEGIAEKTSRTISENYFATRPRSSQIAAWVSHQGTTLASRADLESKFKAFSERFEGKKIPMPDHWGGIRLLPHRFEFWQGRPFRLHDRFQYVEEGGVWKVDRISP